jgi:hypothetical protein
MSPRLLSVFDVLTGFGSLRFAFYGSLSVLHWSPIFVCPIPYLNFVLVLSRFVNARLQFLLCFPWFNCLWRIPAAFGVGDIHLTMEDVYPVGIGIIAPRLAQLSDRANYTGSRLRDLELGEKFHPPSR